MSRLKEKYQNQIKASLQGKFKYRNAMMIPKLHKVVVSMGLAEAIKDKNAFQDALEQLALLTGQKPRVTLSRKSIAAFKLREGQQIGAFVTLRGERMYAFCDRFFNVSCPRIHDFRGFARKGDSRGSYSLGIKEQQIFPEIDLNKIKRSQGMNITFVTTATNDQECLELLKELGLPFREK